MGVRDIDDIIEQEIINKMDVSVKITSATLINDSYKITLCNQKYARIMSKLFQETTDPNGDAVTIEWEISLASFDEDGSFFVTNSDPFYTLKSGDILSLPLPHYFRGTPLAVNGEWRMFSPNEWDKLPMVWLAQPTDEEWFGNESALERVSDVTLFFIAGANFRDDFTKDLRVKQVVPLMNMANLAIDYVKKSPVFGKDFTYNTRDFSKFGRETDRGTERNIIDSDLSSVRLRMSLPIYKGNDCDCSPMVMLPDYVSLSNSNNEWTYNAPNSLPYEVPDVNVVLGNGTQTFPSNIDIDLSQYNVVAKLPSGIYIPNTTVTSEFELLWEGVSVDCETGLGFISRFQNFGEFDMTGLFVIPHNGDFTVEFYMSINPGPAYPFAGLSYHKARAYYANITHAIYRQSIAQEVWEAGQVKAGIQDSATVVKYEIERSGSLLIYRANGVVISTVDIINTGTVNFDTSFAHPSSVYDIKVIIP